MRHSKIAQVYAEYLEAWRWGWENPVINEKAGELKKLLMEEEATPPPREVPANQRGEVAYTAPNLPPQNFLNSQRASVCIEGRSAVKALPQKDLDCYLSDEIRLALDAENSIYVEFGPDIDSGTLRAIVRHPSKPDI